MIRRFLLALTLAAAMGGVCPGYALTPAQKVILLSQPGPSLDLNFTQMSALPAIVSFSRSSTATYFNNSGLLMTAAANAPRFDYDPVTLTPRGLLSEEQRTNLLLQSNGFGTTWAVGTSQSAVSSGAITSPDGSIDGWKLYEATTTSGDHAISQGLSKAASSLPYALTVYAKAAERSRIALKVANGSNGVGAAFDLVGGQVNTPDVFGTGWTSVSATIQSVGGGWYRCTLIATSDTTTTVQAVLLVDNGTGTAARSTTYAGTVGSGIYIYGAQLEQASFPTSYIPTTTAAATRGADVATVATSVIGFNPNAGTLIGEAISSSGVQGSTILVVSEIDDGTGNNRHLIGRLTGLQYRAAAVVGGTITGDLAGGTWSNSTFEKIGYSYDAGGFSLYAAGAQVQTKGAAALPAGLTTLRIGASASGPNWNGPISRVRYWPRRLSNAQLQSLTQ